LNSSGNKDAMAPALLLGLKLKKTDREHSFRTSLGAYVEAHHGTAAGERASADIEELDDLRSLVTDADLRLQPSTEELFAQYYGNLRLVQRRFPSVSSHAFQFRWHDAFQPDHVVSASLGAEIAATVFNLSAFLSQMAIHCNKETADDLALSGKYFMKAAGALAYLRSELGRGRLEAETVDLSPECLEMLEAMMTTQAIECIVEKGAKAGTGKVTLARLAWQVAAQTRDIHGVLCGPQLHHHFEKPWHNAFRVKAHYYDALACLYQGDHLRDALEGSDIQLAVRSQVSYAQAAKDHMLEAQRLCGAVKLNPTMKGEIDRMVKEVTARVGELQRENATTYLQRVVPLSDLEQIEPLSPESLPQATTLGYLVEPIASLTFKSVVPEQVTRDWSKYTDMLDKLIREEQERIHQASDAEGLRLREMELPDRLHATRAGHGGNVPDAIRIELERIEEMGGITYLWNVADQLTEMNVSISRDLEECRHAPDATRYAANIESYANNINVAKRTDDLLRNMLSEEEENLRGLTMADAVAQAPHVESRMLLMDTTEPAEAAQALEMGMEGLKALSKQLTSLEETLKRTRDGDEIVDSLLSATSIDCDAVIRSNLAKYEPTRQSITELLRKQESILDAMSDASRVFEGSYDFAHWEKMRRRMVDRWRTRIDSFKDISAKLREGLEFYVTLSDAVGALKRTLLGSAAGAGNGHRPDAPFRGSHASSGGASFVHDLSEDISRKLHVGEGFDGSSDAELSGYNPLARRK